MTPIKVKTVSLKTEVICAVIKRNVLKRVVVKGKSLSKGGKKKKKKKKK